MQRVAIDLARTQRARGIKAKIIGLYIEENLLIQCRIAGVPFNATPGIRFNWKGVWHLRKLLHNFEPHLVHLHSSLAWSTLVTFFLRKNNQKVILHLHNYHEVPDSFKSYLNKRAIRTMARRVIAVSHSVADDFIHETPEFNGRVDVVYNGVNVEPRRQNRVVGIDGAQCFGMATRLDPTKGVFEFLDAAAAILARLPSSRFSLAGEGPAREALLERASALGIAERFTLVGFCSDIQNYWRSVDVALFTASSEPFGLRLLEPLCYGVPVVAFKDQSGAAEVIQRCRGILSCSCGDMISFSSLAVRLATDKEYRSNIANLGIADIACNFTLPKMEAAVARVYKKVLSAECVD